MHAFDLYRSQTWVDEPLMFGDDVNGVAEEIYYPERHDENAEFYESWYHDGNTLSLIMLSEVYRQNKALSKKNFFELRTGHLAFIAARFPRLLKTLSEDAIRDLNSNTYLNRIQGFGCGDESFAWFLLFDLGKWYFSDQDSPVASSLLTIKTLHDAGISFDQARPFITAGTFDADVIIGAIRNDIDIEILSAVK